MDIRVRLQSTLETEFIDPFEVMPEELLADTLVGEYITYKVIGEIHTSYANNKPIWKRTTVDVNYYTQNVNKKLVIPAQIQKLLLDNDFKMVNGQRDILREGASAYYGVTQEFAFEECIIWPE